MTEILDSTLRDGAQAEGISYSVSDKLNIVRLLDGLGIAVIEAGNPASNPKEAEFFREVKALKLANSMLCAFGSTRHKDSSVENDKGCAALLEADTPAVSIFGKCWCLHVDEILQTDRKENLHMIADTCRFFSQKGKRVIFDAEHFFDGVKDDKGYAVSALDAAVSGGADTLVLCDTNGGSFPDEIYDITKEIVKRYPDKKIGIHLHDDSGMATAGSVMAVKAGAVHVQGTLTGFGERCGNANLSAIIPNLQLKAGYECLPEEKLQTLTPTVHEVSEISNLSLKRNTPFVGRSAFAHKAGMHADAVMKLPKSFEQVDPAAIGNKRRLLMSEMTGRAAVLGKIRKLYPEVQKDDNAVSDILETLKKKEFDGYQYEGADASFELIIKKRFEKIKPFFDLISYKVLDEMPPDNNKSATATIKITVGGKIKIAASDGNGPVNALDIALREALSEFYPCLNEMRLTDYKVRVMDTKQTTASVTRVLITSADSGEEWTTVGVSADIIGASWAALVDSIEHKLIKNGVTV